MDPGLTGTAPNFLNMLCMLSSLLFSSPVEKAPSVKIAGWARPRTRVFFSRKNCLTMKARSPPGSFDSVLFLHKDVEHSIGMYVCMYVCMYVFQIVAYQSVGGFPRAILASPRPQWAPVPALGLAYCFCPWTGRLDWSAAPKDLFACLQR